MFGIHEHPSRSVSTHLDGVEFPATRRDIVEAATDGDAPPSVINVLQCLPQTYYERRDEVLRDLSEAARRYAYGPSRADPLRDRRNIGRRNESPRATP